MGIFGKKEDVYRIIARFPGRVSLEDQVLVALFEACKRHGMNLLREPQFDDLPGQIMVTAVFPGNVHGHLTWFINENDAMLDFYRPINAEISDSMMAEAMKDWLQTLNAMGIDLTFSAEKEGKRRYSMEKWDAVYPEHRSFM